MRDLFQKIKSFVAAEPHGWCTYEKAVCLASAIISTRLPALEIGVYSGKSCIPMALTFKALGTGYVIGVDPWNASASVEGQTEVNVKWWGAVNHEAIYQTFMGYCRRTGTDEYIRIHRMSSDAFTVTTLPTKLGLLHVDGNHGQQAFKDVQKFAPHVTLGGFCFMDDVGWDGGGPKAGTTWLLDNGFVHRYDMDAGAMYQRITEAS